MAPLTGWLKGQFMRTASLNRRVSSEWAARCCGVMASVAQCALAMAGLALGIALFSGRATAAPAVSVDANAASAAELERVRGIGPALASRIIAARSTGGQFRDNDDFRRRVRGVGEANLRRMLASGLVLGGASRIVPEQAASRDQVDLVVGNVPAKSEFRGLGRIEEVRCCAAHGAGEAQQRGETRLVAAAADSPVKPGTASQAAPQAKALATASTAPEASALATAPTASPTASAAPPEPRSRPRR